MRERRRARRPAAAAAPARQRQPLVPATAAVGPAPLLVPTLLPPASPPPVAAQTLAPEAETAGADAPETEAITAPAPVAELPEVALLIPPPPPDLASRTQSRARATSGRMADAGAANRALPSPTEETAAARAHVQEPAEETTARAQGAIATKLRERPAPSPEIEKLCDDIQDAIENRRPVDEDSLRRTNPQEQAQAVGDALNSGISSDTTRVGGEYAGLNQEATGVPEQIAEDLPATPHSVDAPGARAAGVTPPPATAADVSLEADRAATATRIEEANIDNAVTQQIPAPPFSDAREGMAELEQTAAEHPARVLQEQAAAIAESQGAIRAVEDRAVAALKASRAGTVDDTLSQQLAMAGTEEEMRVAAAALAEDIFTKAQAAVKALLDDAVPEAMKLWNTGKAQIATAFDTELQVAKDMVDERHEGIGGAIVSLWDDATGLPSNITRIYTRAERNFGRDICALIRQVSTQVNGVIIAAEEIIDNAEAAIAKKFSDLPAGLQDWATQQQQGFSNRLDALRDDVHATQQNFTNDLVSQAGDAVQEARERIDALREAAKGFIQKVADAIEAFIDDPVRAIINGLLTVVGIAPGAFWALLAQIEEVASDIADDPLTFANNLMAAVGQGFAQFFDGFFGHLLTGFINWLMSAMGSVGVELPADTSLKSLITFFLQLMGLTWPNIREILVRHVGEENMELIEQAYELLALLIEQGPGGIFELIRERLDPTAILNTIIEAAVTYLVETIVSVATVRILGLFNPVGAVLQAIEAIYKVLKWIFENAARIFTLVQTIVQGVADLIAGNIEGMAKKTEEALAGMLVPVIDFIAGFLSLGDLPDKIAEVVGGFQEVVLEAVDAAIGFLVERARGLLQTLGLGGDAGEGQSGEDEEVGKSISFSAEGEGHRMWIDADGAVEVMVASDDPQPLGKRIAFWRTELSLIADDLRELARSSLNTAEAENTILITEATAVDRAFDQRTDGNPPPPAVMERDDRLEERQTGLVPVLVRLFDIFMGGAPFETARRDVNIGDTTLALEIRYEAPHLAVYLENAKFVDQLAALNFGVLSRAHHRNGLDMIRTLTEATATDIAFIEAIELRNGRIHSVVLSDLTERLARTVTAVGGLRDSQARSFAHLQRPPPHDITRQTVQFSPNDALTRPPFLAEYERQLGLQQDGINEQLVDQWILNRNANRFDDARFNAIDNEERRALMVELNRRAAGVTNAAGARAERLQRVVAVATAVLATDDYGLTAAQFAIFRDVTGRFGNEDTWKKVHLTDRAGTLEAVRAEMDLQQAGFTAVTTDFAILHNPDQIGGGFGEIPAVTEVPQPPNPTDDHSAYREYLRTLGQYIGSGKVNSSIGPSWTNRSATLEASVRAGYRIEGWGIWKMNVELTL